MSAKTACSVRHTFALVPCGRPASWRIVGTSSRCCESCREQHMRHMPAALFRPVVEWATTMTSAPSFAERAAIGLARDVIDTARERGFTGVATRRRMREVYETISARLDRGRWYRACVKAAGCLLLDIPDFCQPSLIELGPKRRRTRRTALFGRSKRA